MKTVLIARNLLLINYVVRFRGFTFNIKANITVEHSSIIHCRTVQLGINELMKDFGKVR